MEVSRQAVSKWESDQAMPDVEKILKMSRLFDISTDTLLKEELDLNPPFSQSETEPQQKSRADSRPIPVALRVFRSVFWPLVVAVYLMISFFTEDWGRTWIVWPVAAVLFTVVNIIWSTAVKTAIDENGFQ